MRKARVVIHGNDVYMDGYVVATLTDTAPATIQDAFLEDVLYGANQAHPTLPLKGGLYASGPKGFHK